MEFLEKEEGAVYLWCSKGCWRRRQGRRDHNRDKGLLQQNCEWIYRTGEHRRMAAGGDYTVTLGAHGRTEPDEEQSPVRALTSQKPRALVSRQALFQAVTYHQRNTAGWIQGYGLRQIFAAALIKVIG